MPTICSFATFIPRPTDRSLGLLFAAAAAIRSLRPSSNPAFCGPRIAFAPGERDQVVAHRRVVPEVRDRRHIRRPHRESTGRHVRAPRATTPRAISVPPPRRLEEERHRRARRERAFVVGECVSLHEPRSTHLERVFVREPMPFLNEDLVLLERAGPRRNVFRLRPGCRWSLHPAVPSESADAAPLETQRRVAFQSLRQCRHRPRFRKSRRRTE